MKTLNYFVLVIVITIVGLTFTGCKKKKSENPVENLPAATQEGKNTFGCLINGVAFIPGARIGSLSHPLELNINPFRLRGSDLTERDLVTPSIFIILNNIVPKEGTEYILNDAINSIGEYNISINTNITSYKTNATNTGKLKITKYDMTNHIVSGIFSFDAVNTNGEKVEIREGRFDVKY